MTTWNPIANDLFLKALEYSNPSERQEFLDRACAGDVALRAEVDSLLVASVKAGGFLESPANVLGVTVDLPSDAEQSGAMIGPYKLLEQIGEGGMGTVWMVQQSEPVKRVVALKLIKAGMDSKQVIARFEAERQALALMDHVNIARVLDAGTTSAGRPYFVMDLVKGLPITKYCDEHHLTPRQRLELFIPVCQAVQHAHQKGIIHRDLKPSNVLVALYDGRPVTKVIDFGVAKAAGQPLTDKTLVTGFGALVGTLEYMSPEQAEINQLDIDTRSDIYSLGVLLYELLTGSPPFSRKDLEKSGMLEMLRVIREQEPSKPSTKLSTAEGLPTLAANRGTEPAKLTKLVRGELDWIVMKALEKDRNRRYETANGFAMDVQRYLADEPVMAGPPGAGYRLRKFVRRNLGAVVAASLIVLLLLGGIAGTAVGLLIARHERDEAENARQDQAREADRAVAAEKIASTRLAQVESEKLRADEERAVAQAVSDFLQKDLLGQASFQGQPGGESGKRDPNITVRTVLDRAAKKIEGRFAKQPRVEAAIRATLAVAYFQLGLLHEARLHAERAVELRDAHLGADHDDTLSSKSMLAVVFDFSNNRDRAKALMLEVLEKRIAIFGPDHLGTLRSKYDLGSFYVDPRSPEAEVARAGVLLEEVVQKQTALLGTDHVETLKSKLNLAWFYNRQGEFDRAAATYSQLLDFFQAKFGDDYELTLLCQSNLGLMYQKLGKLDQAELLLRAVLQKRIALQGENHRYTLGSKCYLARLYQAQRKYDRAVPLYEQARAQFKELRDGSNELFVLDALVRTLFEAGQPERALTLVGELVNGQRQLLGATSPQFVAELVRICESLLKHKQYPEAEKHLRECLAINEKSEPDIWDTFDIQSMLGAALMGQEKYGAAAPLLLRGYEGMKQRLDKIPAQTRSRLTDALERLVQLYVAWGKPDEAAKWRSELDAQKKATEKPAKPKDR